MDSQRRICVMVVDLGADHKHIFHTKKSEISQEIKTSLGNKDIWVDIVHSDGNVEKLDSEGDIEYHLRIVEKESVFFFQRIGDTSIDCVWLYGGGDWNSQSNSEKQMENILKLIHNGHRSCQTPENFKPKPIIGFCYAVPIMLELYKLGYVIPFHGPLAINYNLHPGIPEWKEGLCKDFRRVLRHSRVPFLQQQFRNLKTHNQCAEEALSSDDSELTLYGFFVGGMPQVIVKYLEKTVFADNEKKMDSPLILFIELMDHKVPGEIDNIESVMEFDELVRIFPNFESLINDYLKPFMMEQRRTTMLFSEIFCLLRALDWVHKRKVKISALILADYAENPGKSVEQTTESVQLYREKYAGALMHFINNAIGPLADGMGIPCFSGLRAGHKNGNDQIVRMGAVNISFGKDVLSCSYSWYFGSEGGCRNDLEYTMDDEGGEGEAVDAVEEEDEGEEEEDVF